MKAGCLVFLDYEPERPVTSSYGAAWFRGLPELAFGLVLPETHQFARFFQALMEIDPCQPVLRLRAPPAPLRTLAAIFLGGLPSASLGAAPWAWATLFLKASMRLMTCASS